MSKAARDLLFRCDLPVDEDPILRVIDRRIPWAIHSELYSHQCFGTGAAPDQGWKLHVAATPLSAVEVLHAALDVLFSEGARFKVARSIRSLSALNAGDFGISQIGKFIAVYPSDDDQAVRLALKLDDATRGRRGPRVPSDRPLRPNSVVHYRYGAMRLRPEADAAGELAIGAYDLLDPAGRLTNDIRQNFYVPPPAIVDPFETSGAYVPRPGRSPLLNGRYLVIDALSQSPRGGVFRAVDLETRTARLCLLKEFWHDVCLDEYGRDARDWAANEERILSRHDDDQDLPRFFGHFELDGNRYNAIEYVEGTPLDRSLTERYAATDGVPPSDVIAIGLATADVLANLHAIGIVFRDFKPANVIKTPDGGYRLIDFGIAYEDLEERDPPLGAGTPVFCSPEQFDGRQPTPSDDIFAWGAVLHYLACGDASLADMPADPRRQHPVPRRLVRDVNIAFPPSIGAVIDRAVAWEQGERWRTMREARAALREAAGRLETVPTNAPAVAGVSPAEPKGEAPTRLSAEDTLRRARDVGDALCATAEQRGGGLCWATWNELGERRWRCPDLYSGAAGIGLFLAELAHATGEGRYAETARGAARWLAGPAWGRGWGQHGLHGGEPGVALFFLRLAELLDEPHYVTAAELRMRRLRDAPFLTVDLLHGMAGTILSLLRLHAVSGESSYLADARAAGDELVRAALPAPKGNASCYWEVASADPGGMTAPYLGLLHGAAGIGLALAQLATAANEEHYLDVAMGAAELLLAQARHPPARIADSGGSEHGVLVWPRQLDDKSSGIQAHCHGAGGIGQFLLRLNRLVPDVRYREAAKGAAHTVAARREGEPHSCVCHGLSGIGNVLLDSYQMLGDPQFLALACNCAARLQRFGRAEQPGTYTMSIGGPVSPDLMLGYAGVGSFLLRLSNSDTAYELLLG
jgi:hypothetical protein